MVTPPDLRMTTKIYDASSNFIVEFPSWNYLAVLDCINDIPSFNMSFPLKAKNASSLISDTDLQIAVCLDKADGNGFVEVSRFFYEQDNYDPSMSESAIVQATGRGIISILENGIIYPQGGVGSTKTSWSFAGQSWGSIFHTFITAAQARGCFPSVTMSFTSGQDSAGNAWTHGFTGSFDAGTTILDLAMTAAQNNLIDVNMTGTTLNVYNPGTTLATDRSSSIFLRRSRDIETLPAARDRSNIKTVMLAIGDNGLNVERTASTLGTLGRKEGYLAQSGVSDSGTLNYWADQALGAIDDQQISLIPTYVVDVSKGSPVPWKDYFPGDYISIDQAGTPLKYRARQWSVQCTAGGPVQIEPTLNDVFYDLEAKIQGTLTSLTSGSVGAVGKTMPQPGQNSTVPDVPAFVPASIQTAAYYSPATGTTLAQIELSWTTPNNTNGTPMLDGFQYLIQYRLSAVPIYPVFWTQVQGKSWASINGNPWTNILDTPQNQQWTTLTVGIDDNTVVVPGLICGESYDFQIACTDVSGNTGAFSAVSSFATARDSVAPVQPDAPTVNASMVAVQVMHDLGSATGGSYNLAQDLDHLEVHFSYDPSFVAVAGIGSPTYLGKLLANAGMMKANVPAVGTFQVTSVTGIYIRVIAVDVSGNISPASPSSGVTAVLIDDQHISSLSVSKLIAGTISANIILGSSIGTALSGARVVMDGTTDALYTYDTGGNLIGAWAGAAGSDPSNSTAFSAGWNIFNDPGNGYVKVVSNTPGTGFAFSSPRFYLSSDPTKSVSMASIYSSSGSSWEQLRVNGSVSTLAFDPHQSQVWMDLYGGFADDAAQGHLHFKDTNGETDRISWDSGGVKISHGPSSSPVIGNAIIDCSVTTGFSNKYIYYSVANGSTNGAGQFTFTHGAPFTPLIIMGFSAAPDRQFYCSTITSTTATATVYTAAGALVASSGVSFFIMCIGDN